MSTFRSALQIAKAPGRTILLEPWVFADEWSRKPKDAVCVGIRIPSEGDKTKARASAEQLANSLHEADRKHVDRFANWVDCFNDCLIRQVVALGICDPNDVTRGTDLLPMAEDEVRFALSSRGARWIFDQIEKYEIESSTIEPQVEDDELAEFADLLTEHSDRLLPSHRRLLAHVRQVLTGD